MPPETDRLSQIEAYLEDNNYAVDRTALSEDGRIEQLLVPFFEDNMGRPYFMQIIFLQDFTADDEGGPVGGPTLVQFYATLPEELPSERLPDIGRVFHFVNQSMPLGYYGYLEDIESARASYRFVGIWQDSGEADNQLVEEVFTVAGLSIERISAILTDMANGVLSAEEALQDVAVNGLFPLPKDIT